VALTAQPRRYSPRTALWSIMPMVKTESRLPLTFGTRSTHPANDPIAALAAFEESLSVSLIATPRSDFHTCRPDEELIAVVERNQNGFTYFPVVTDPDGSGERIIGLFEVAPFMRGHVPRELVRECMHPLSEDNLIGADASLLAFVRTADRYQCRLLISGPTIDGLVTLSDLQRLPVRAVLFAIVTDLEITMTSAIRREFTENTGWAERLSQGRRLMIEKEILSAKARNAFVDSIKSEFARDLKSIQELRDALAHANEYANSREAARRVCKTVRLIDLWKERLAAWQPAPFAAG